MRFRVLPEAEAELLEAALHYEDCQDGLGLDFYQRDRDCVALIAEHPLRFPLYEGMRQSGGFRRATIERFPYLLVYKVFEDETLLVAVAHASRRPGYWKHRAS